MMRLVKKIILLVAVVTIHSCDYLDVPPINIIQDDAIFLHFYGEDNGKPDE